MTVKSTGSTYRFMPLHSGHNVVCERVCVSSINQIPFRERSFDAVVSVDVLECEAVDEMAAYSEMWRVLKPGGLIAL